MSQWGNLLANRQITPYEEHVLHTDRFRSAPACLVKDESFAGKLTVFSSA
jgi:hypothetical protein